VLEFGAGRTGFAESIGPLRDRVHLTVQDVTPVNADYLRLQADQVHIGKISDLRGPFDVIFSTFVLEHITDPKSTLETIFKLLEPGGSLLLFCPRYDVPFYLSHSADHYGWLVRLRMAAAVCWRRFATVVTGRPAFVIHSDPAILHLGWRMDRDAIHWASLIDLRVFFRDRGKLEKLAIRSGSFRDWCVKNLLRINILFTRAAH
jgi:SAM-dependent methyltransferase